MTAYTDGGIHYNCPALVADFERKLIWNEGGDQPSDFLLSLGTGLSGRSSKTQLQPASPVADCEEIQKGKELGLHRSISGIRYGFRVAFKIIDDQLNCEDIWDRYYSKVTSHGINKIEDRRRNMRINVQLSGERPGLDKVEDVEEMEQQSLWAVQSEPEIRTQIHEAAHRLVASCFYFEKSTAAQHIKGSAGYSCLGKLQLSRNPVSTQLTRFFLPHSLSILSSTPLKQIQSSQILTASRKYTMPLRRGQSEPQRFGRHPP